MMKINIIKAVNNSHYVRMGDNLYWSIGLNAKRIWTKESIGIEPSKTIIYSLKLSNDQVFEGYIVDSGEDEMGSYFVFSTNGLELDNEEFDSSSQRFVRGVSTIREVLNLHKKSNLQVLLGFDDQSITCISNVSIKYQKTDDQVLLDVKLGSLIDKTYHFVLEDIVSTITNDHLDLHHLNTSGICTNVLVRVDQEGLYKVIIQEVTYQKEGMHKEVTSWSCSKLTISKGHYIKEICDEKGIGCRTLKASQVKGIREAWEDNFVGDVETKDIYYDQFLWHVFSYERLQALKLEEADEALSNVTKDSLYVFVNSDDQYGREIGFELTGADLFDLEILACYSDVYVCDTLYTWTYVSTHEDGWIGPFYYVKE